MLSLMDPTASHQRSLLTAALRTSGPILEMGAGWYSTPILLATAEIQGRRLVTLDTDAEWLSRFAPRGVERPWHRRGVVTDWAEADLLPGMAGADRWGLVFVDQAPPPVRGPVVKRLRGLTDVFVLHDTEAPVAYGYDRLETFRYQVTDRSHWTWATVASDSVDVTAWGLEEFSSEEQPPSVAQYLLRTFPGGERWFVEAGAHARGRGTLELERSGWRGICVEPSSHCQSLALNRRCLVRQALLGEWDGQLATFCQFHGEQVEMSGILDYFMDEDELNQPRRSSEHDHKIMATLRLSTLLQSCGAPAAPEFLCLDTEGSELAILRGHDFGLFRFQTILVDYGGVASRRKELDELLTSRGYGKSRGRGWDDGKNLMFVSQETGGI